MEKEEEDLFSCFVLLLGVPWMRTERVEGKGRDVEYSAAVLCPARVSGGDDEDDDGDGDGPVGLDGVRSGGRRA